MVKYKRNSDRKFLIFTQNERNCWFRLQTECAWSQKTCKPWKHILVTIWMPQGCLIRWLFWLMRYQVSVRKWKTLFLALLHLLRIATFFLTLVKFCNLCTCCQLQLLLQSVLFHLFVFWKCTCERPWVRKVWITYRPNDFVCS